MRNRLFWLKQHLFRRKAVNEYKLALANESVSVEQLDALNWQKRKRIVQYAYENIQYYKKKFESIGFHPSLLRERNDWRLVPVLEKEEIRTNFNSMINPHLPASYLVETTTGGSTGEPLKTYRDRTFPEDILKWRMLQRYAVGPGANIAMLWRIPGRQNSTFHKLVNKAIWWPTKRIKLDASITSENDLSYLHKRIQTFQRILIWGYVGAVERFAMFLKRKALRLDNITLVWATAAPISDVQKKLFSDVFKTDVLNQYAFSEIHFVASSCPSCNNLLVDSDYRHVDILRQDGSNASLNELGDIVVTDLQNQVFPLIKYRVGDQTKWVKHQCNRPSPFPVFAPVMGRVSDFLIVPGQGVINGEYLTTVFDDYTDSIQQFRFHQNSNYDVEIKIVPTCSKKEADIILDNVISNICAKAGAELRFHKNMVDEISHDRGKLRFVTRDPSCKV